MNLNGNWTTASVTSLKPKIKLIATSSILMRNKKHIVFRKALLLVLLMLFNGRYLHRCILYNQWVQVVPITIIWAIMDENQDLQANRPLRTLQQDRGLPITDHMKALVMNWGQS